MRNTMLLAFSFMLFAGGGVAQDGPKTHGRLGIGTSTVYFFRGLLQQDGGLIVQPSLQVGRGGGELFGLPFGWHLGTWNSLHEGQTGTSAGGGSPAWYESRFFGGFTFDVVDDVSITTEYLAYHSPNGRFRLGSGRPVQELVFRGTWDDTKGAERDWLVGFQPYAELAVELTGFRDAGPARGVYLELGAEPVFERSEGLTFTTPVRLGLSLKDYYEDGRGGDDVFGFCSVGARGILSLCDESSVFGPWKLRASVDLYILGDTAKRVNNNDGADLVAGLELVLKF